MKTVYDVQQLLKRYGVFVYTGERKGDLLLLEIELEELWRSKVIQITEFQTAKLIIRQEIAYENSLK